MPFASEYFNDVAHTFDDAMRRFVEELGAWRMKDRLQCSAARTCFGRKESGKAEGVSWQTAGNQCRKERRRSRHGHNANVMTHGEGDQAITGIADAGHAGIADHGDVVSPFQMND